MPPDSNQNPNELFTSKQKLEEAALEIANKAPQDLHQATYLYFLARYLVIYYEVNFAHLPTQVWNEYRNALDHYFRCVTGENENESSRHLSKMEGHLQRAVLDVCKIICHATEERFAKALTSENQEALRLVDNCEFFPLLTKAFKNAKDSFLSAKASDLLLGDGAHKDKEIVGRYLQAFYSYRDAEIYLDESRGKIATAEQQVKTIKHQTSKHHIRDSLIAKAIWYTPVFLLTLFLGANYSDALKGYFVAIKAFVLP